MDCANWERISESISIEMKNALNALSGKPGWRDYYQNNIYKIWHEENWHNFILAVRTAQNEIRKDNFPLKAYTNVGFIKPENKTRRVLYFDLRYMGQTVAQLKVNINGEKHLAVEAKKGEPNFRDFGRPGDEYVLRDSWNHRGHSVPLDDERAAAFLDFFRRKPQRNIEETGSKADQKKMRENAEHNVESNLIGTLYAERAGLGIQPVQLYDTEDSGIRFAMTTALSASKPHRKNNFKIHTITAAEKGSGGIDILAVPYPKDGRVLTVIEVKDQYTDKEPPLVALGQASAYAVFLQQLLRDEQGPMWWKLFGMKGEIPEQLTIRIVSAMPYKENAPDDLKGLCGTGRYIPIEADKPHGDRVEVHTLFFKDEGREIAETTLGK